jgi:hypothetical protein
MASKKQRRRREKDRRHDYEYVYYDEEGRELKVESLGPKEDKSSKPKQIRTSPNGHPPAGLRPVKPPNWRTIRMQALFLALIYFALLMITAKKGTSIWGVLLQCVVLVGVMVPFMWYFQRLSYRSYLRRVERTKAASERPKKDA